jgi:hypothetical protein
MLLSLHYQDARERTQALVSIAHRCLDLDTRCLFFGSEAECEATREAVEQLGALRRTRQGVTRPRLPELRPFEQH